MIDKKFTSTRLNNRQIALAKRAAKRVSDRNYRFRLMTPAQKRVRIAKDVIEQLALGKLVAASRGYLTINDARLRASLNSYGSRSSLADTPWHSIFEKESCTVCGIGGVFVAAVGRANKCTVDDSGGSPEGEFMKDYLAAWFDRSQLTMIETAFERDSSFGYSNESEIDDALEFSESLDDPGERLTAIMQNIIDNDGNFRP